MSADQLYVIGQGYRLAPDLDFAVGMASSNDWYTVIQESELARGNPDMLQRSSHMTADEPMWSSIVPDKPDAVSMAGYDVFGPPAFQTTTRNSVLDLRGEAVTGPIIGQAPEGAMMSPLMGMVPGGFSAALQGGSDCPCNRNRSGYTAAPYYASKPKINFLAHPVEWVKSKFSA
jgi:hypothetical protein